MSVVLDSSAVLAFLKGEPGAERVMPHLPGAAISAINVAEVLSVLTDQNAPPASFTPALAAMGLRVVPFDSDAATATAALRPLTRSAGLSLADRACLALAQSLNCKALTADRAWARLDLNVVELIR